MGVALSAHVRAAVQRLVDPIDHGDFAAGHVGALRQVDADLNGGQRERADGVGVVEGHRHADRAAGRPADHVRRRRADRAQQAGHVGGVEQVQFDWEWLARLRRLISIVNLAGFVAGGILAVAAAFTIANVIRLTMMLYREEIEIMRLVGATETIIRGPFLIEGLLQGLLGAALAVALLVGAFFGARHFLVPANSLLWSFLFNGFLPWQKIAALFGGGMLAGYLGSWLSVRESRDEVSA